MTRNAIVGLALGIANLCFTCAAQAADGAQLGMMAYSPDTRYFAFEQMGVEDGSGALYSEIFVIDLEKNSWVGSTPYRVRIEEATVLAPVRAEALAKAKAQLKLLDISEPVEVLVDNPATEVITDRSHIQFDRYFLSSQAGSSPTDNVGMVELRYELSVERSVATLPSTCPQEDGPYYGVTLKLKSVKSGATAELYRDKVVPTSRRCPMSYDIAAVIAPLNYPKVERLVAIIGVYSFGFEGSDRRYIAVPFLLQ